MLRVGSGRRFLRISGGKKRPIFSLPLNDLGAGAVNTTPIIARGSNIPTFTRTTVAWTKLSTGLWAQIASGQARSCYLGADTTVGAYGGYFAEGAGTQLLNATADIRDMTGANWTLGATMTRAHTSTGIDGTANSATRLTGGAVPATNIITTTITAAASNRTYSCFIKRITGSGPVRLTQDNFATNTDISGSINSSTYTRVPITQSQLNAVLGIKIDTNTDAVDVDFNQFESGAFATSPMATAGAARNADVLTYLVSGNILDANASVYFEVSSFSWANAAGWTIGANAAGQGAFLVSSTNGINVWDGTNTVTGPAGVPSGLIKQAASWSGSVMRAFASGSAGTAGAFDGSMNTGATMGIGNLPGGSGQINGTIRNVRIFNRALTDAQLQAMTT